MGSYRIKRSFLIKLSALLIFNSAAESCFAQDKLKDVNYKKFFTAISRKDSVIKLPDKFVTENSLSVYLDSAEVSKNNYTADLRFGKLSLRSFFMDEIFSDTTRKNPALIIAYRNLPFDIPDSYSRFEFLEKLDTLKEDTVRIAEVRTDYIQDIFSGTDLQKSGSIFRGFTLGNNRDLTLNSGFRLQMNGQLSKDIDIVAALTDESTPIQPEGNTQKLQEIDNVFVELKSKNVTTTLGDMDVTFSDLNFFNFNKKLQGAKGSANFGATNMFLSGAISRGRFSTNSFNGTDGIQGPYKLVGADNEVNIIVIAGSEKVFLDGIKMGRGETFDYTIDYSNGSITFTNNRLIRSSSRIVVDFEYSDKKYSRSIIVGQVKSSLFDDKLGITFSMLRQNDNRDRPVDFILSDSDKTIISNAGDDKLKASKTGVVFVGSDSLGNPLGLYVKVDTLINSSPYTLYRYAPGDTGAFYQVSFSFVGSGKGDYNSLSSTVFQFAGIGGGGYLPVVFLPVPVLYQSGDLAVDLKLSESFSFKFESALSDYDRNLFSDDDDKNNKGIAVNSVIALGSKKLMLGRTNFGEAELVFKQNYINKLYNSVDRLYTVEYNRVWDIQDSSIQTEITSELGLRYRPQEFLVINALGGRNSRGDFFRSLRGSGEIYFLGDSLGIPGFNYNADYISSRDEHTNYSGQWIRQNGIIDYKLAPFAKQFGTYVFAFGFNGEDKQTRSLSSDSVSAGSFKYYEFKPKFLLSDFFKFDLSYEFQYRFDDIYDSGSLARQSNSLTHTYSVRVKELDFLASNLDIVFFDRKFSDLFVSKGFSDSRTILVTSQSNLWFFNRALEGTLFYKVTSDRTAKSQVVFQYVGLGKGNYKYKGDLNGNNIQDENEFELVGFDGDYVKVIIPTDQSFPTTYLQSSVGMNLNPSRLLTDKGGSITSLIINNISFDTYLSVSEKSKDPEQKNIYLMNFSKFQNETYTINGSNLVQQDVNLFQNYEYFGFRFRFLQRKNFNQFYSGSESFLGIERSVRLRLTFTEDISLVSDYVSETNRNNSQGLGVRNWNIISGGIQSELTYVPFRLIEVGFKADLKRSTDNYPAAPTEADINSQTLKFTYSLEGRGRFRVEASRNEVVLNSNPLFLPFELTKGLFPGKSFLWTLSCDYRVTNFIQATLNYTGRAEGNSRVIHSGTAEVRAYF